MNIRYTALMFGLSLGILWLFGLMLAYKKTAVEENAAMPTFQKVDFSEILTVKMVTKEKDKTRQEFDFTQTPAGWTFGNKIRIDSHRVTRILQDIRGATKNDEERVPADTGIDNPRIIVTITAAPARAKKEDKKEKEPKIDEKKEPREWWIKVGKSNVDKSMVYVQTSDRPDRTIAVSQTSLESLFFLDVREFRTPSPFSFKDNAVKKISIKDLTSKDPKTGELELVKTEPTWKFELPKAFGFADADGPGAKEPPPPNLKNFDKKEKDEEESKAKGGVMLLISNIRALKVESFEDFMPPPSDNDTAKYLAKYGLDEGKEKLRIEVTTTDGKDEVLLIGDDSAEKSYARVGGDPGVFRLTDKQLEPIRKAVRRPEELRSKDILFFKETKGIDMIRLTTADKSEFVLVHPEDKSWLLRMDGKFLKANESAIKTFLATVDGKREIQKFADGVSDKDLGLDSPAFTIALYEDARPRGEDKKKPAAEEVKDKKDDKFAVDTEPAELEGKGRSTEATFKFAKPKSVSPEKDDTIKAEVFGDKVRFTQLVDGDKEDKSVEFTVMGGKDGKDKVEIKVTVRKKPAVTLYFGKELKKIDDKELWPVKRVLQDGTEHPFYLTKELVDKIIPKDVYLTFLDTALPVFDVEDVAGLTIDPGKGKEKVVDLVRSGAHTWQFKNVSAIAGENLADAEKVHGLLQLLTHFSAKKWLQKIDTKKAEDLTQFGLNPPVLTATFVVKKTPPTTVAGIVGMLGSGTGFDVILAGNTFMKAWVDDPGQTVTVRFGKESDSDKDKGAFALFTVEELKDGKKEATNDLLFLVPADLEKRIRSQEFHDRDTVLSEQRILNSRTVSMAIGIGPWGMLAQAPWWDADNGKPLLAPALLTLDPAKVEKIVLKTRGKELREFVFVRETEAPKAVDKKDDKSKEKPSLKGQTWNAEESKLRGFTLDSEKVNELVEELAKLGPQRLAATSDGPRAYQKLKDDDASVRIEIYLDKKQPPTFTLWVGARIGDGRFAHTSAWPQAVFIINTPLIRDVLEGANYFGKDPLAAGE